MLPENKRTLSGHITTTGILAVSLFLSGCSSDSNPAPSEQGLSAQPGIDATPLSPGKQPVSGSNESATTQNQTPPVATAPISRIALQLEDGVLDNIELGSADTPITGGSWPMPDPGTPDAQLFANVNMGNPHYAYPTEVWVDVTSDETAKVMANRMDMAVALGCDGVELDNVDGYTADLWSPSPTGLDITVEQQLKYQRLLANEAHKRNLAVALKNSTDTIVDVADYFDMAINEVCFAYDECGVYKAFTDVGKPVFHVEYDQKYVDDASERAAMCARSAELNMRSLVMPKALDGSYRISCDE